MSTIEEREEPAVPESEFVIPKEAIIESLREQLAAAQAEIDRLKGMVDEIHAARKVVNQHDKMLIEIAGLRQQLAEAQA